MQITKIENTGLTSLEVAEITGKRHDNVKRDIKDEISKLGVEIGSLIFEETYFMDNSNRKQIMYNLTKDGVLQLGARYDAKIRFSLIQRMNQLENKQIPQSFSQALMLAAKQAEQIESLEVKIQENKPKVVFAEALEVSKSSILIGELAKLLKQNDVKIGQNRLFALMRDKGYLGKRGEYYNMPTQRSVNLGILEIKTGTVNNPDGSIRVTKTTKVTGKGQIYFVNKFKKGI